MSGVNPADGAALFVALARALDARVKDLTRRRGRCLRAVPRIDGSAYFDLLLADGPLRLEWTRAPTGAPQGVVRAAAGRSGRSPAQELSAAVQQWIAGWLSGPAGELLGFAGGAVATLEAAGALGGWLEAGRLRWGSWHLIASQRDRSGVLRLWFACPRAQLELWVCPAGASVDLADPPLLQQARFDLYLAADERSAEQRAVLSQQVERFVGFLLSRRLAHRSAPADGARPSKAAAVEEERAEAAAGDEFYLYLNKNPCNASCIFCSRGSRAWKQRVEREAVGHDYAAELESIRDRIEGWRGRGIFHLGGHEPSTYPTLLPIVRAADRAGFRHIVLETNGLALADRELVAELAAAGVTQVRLPLYGHTARVQDAITGVAGSLQMLQQAMTNLEAHSIDTTVKTVVLRQNVEELLELFAVYPEAGCSFVMPSTADAEHYRRVCPRLGEVPPAVLDRVQNLHLPCIFPHRPSWTDPQPNPGAGFVVLDGGRVLFQGREECFSLEQRLQQRVWPEACRDCRGLARCSGIYPMYLELYGDGELVPLSGPA